MAKTTVVTMQFTKATKNTYRFDAPEGAPVKNVYVDKSEFDGQPAEVEVEVRAKA